MEGKKYWYFVLTLNTTQVLNLYLLNILGCCTIFLNGDIISMLRNTNISVV